MLDLSWSGTIAAEYQLRGSEPLPVKEDEEEEGPTDAILVHLDYSDVCHLLVAGTSTRDTPSCIDNMYASHLRGPPHPTCL